jgi:nucleoside-diphosphate-sugar epimerase
LKCAVFGGAGFIGSNIVEALLECGYHVTVLDNFSTGSMKNLESLSGSLEILNGDIRDAELVKKAMNGSDFVNIQAAASSSTMFKSNPREALSINLDGFTNILQTASNLGIKRVVYASSSTIYGNRPDVLEENLIPLPGNLYATSKLCNEYIAQAFCYEMGLETIGLRYMSVYGPREQSKGVYANVVTQFMLAMQSGKRPIIYGDGKQTRDFVFVKDVVQANLLALKAPSISGPKIYNVGVGTENSFNQLIDVLNLALGTKITPEYQPNPIVGYQMRQIGNITKIQTELNFKPSYTLLSGIQKMLQLQGRRNVDT